jgi:hypothetical protein
VDVIDPDPQTILLDDLAWGLSRINRFCGATVTEIPYNNCQHSLFVANLCKGDLGIDPVIYKFALLHDASEAITGDFPSPLKRVPAIRIAIKEIEDRLLSVIYQKFCGRQPTDDEYAFVKYMDVKAQSIEAFHFMHSRGVDWNFPVRPSLIEVQSFPPPKTAIESYKEFLTTYEGANHE